jgi:hypothetical protein
MPSVDDVILRLEAKVDDYNAAVSNATNATERNLKRIDTASSNTEKALRSTRAGMQQLSFQIGDISQQFALGVKPQVIFAEQSGQVLQAVQLMTGGTSAAAAFLTGPWGIALTAAAVAATPFIGKLLETSDQVNDLVKKLQEHARQSADSERANAIFAESLEGVEQAANLARKAIKDLEDGQKTQTEQTVESIRQSLNKARAIRAETAALIDAAEASNEAYKGSLASTDPRIASQFVIAQDRIDALRDKLKRASADAEQLEKDLTKAVSFRIVEQESRSAEEKINDKYDAQIERARKAAVASGLVEAALRKEIAAINAAREAELKRIRDAASASRSSNAQFGRQVSANEAANIARAAGLQVNSATRSTARQQQLYDAWVAAGRPSDNPVARPGTSAHEGANGRWALDIQITADVTPDKIRKVFASQGVKLTKVFKERGHYHIEGSRSDAAAEDRAAEQAQRERERAAQKAQRQEDTFQREKDQLAQQLISAQRGQAVSAEEQDRLDLEAIEATRVRNNNSYRAQEAEQQIAAGKAEELVAVNDAVAAEHSRAIRLRQRERQALEELTLAQGRIDNEADLADAQGALANTVEEQRQSALRLLQLQEQRERLSLAAIIAEKERNNVNDAELKLAKERLGQLDQVYALRREETNRQFEGPLARYARDAKDTDRLVEEAAAERIRDLNSTIAETMADELGIRDPFLKQLLEIFLQQNIFGPLADALSRQGGGGGGFFGAILSGIGAIFGGSGGGSSGSVVKNTLSGKRAMGGPVSAGGAYLVGENGPEVLKMGATPGFVIPNHALQARGQPAGGVVRIMIEEGQNFMSTIRTEATGVAVEVQRATAPGIIRAATAETMRQAGRPRL